MSFAWYTPTLVQSFGAVKNTDINANFNAIAAAFNSLNAQASSTSAYTFGSSGSRSVLVDLSVIQSGYLTVTLPVSPVVGDPPVTVTVVSNPTPASSAAQIPSCVIVTSDGSSIMGVNGTTGGPNGVGDGLPYVSLAGDSITLQFVGGAMGWIITNKTSVSWYSNSNYSTGQPWEPSKTFCLSHGLDLLIGTAGFAGSNGLVVMNGMNFQGLRASVTLTSTAAGSHLTVGTGAQTFNGVAGPYNIAAASIYTRYTFTCLAANTFVVTA